MFRLHVDLRLGNHFRHNAHKATIILVIACFFIFVNAINVIFSYFTAVLMGWVKFGVHIYFGLYLYNCYVIYQIIIYIF